MKRNVTHLGSAALHHYGHRDDNISSMNTQKVSLMNADDTLILTLFPRKMFIKNICENYVRYWMQRRQINFSVLIKKNPTRCNNVLKFIILYLYEAQHVSGDTPPIIRSLKLHWQPLASHTWNVVGRVVGGRCQAQRACQRPPTTRPTTFHV